MPTLCGPEDHRSDLRRRHAADGRTIRLAIAARCLRGALLVVYPGLLGDLEQTRRCRGRSGIAPAPVVLAAGRGRPSRTWIAGGTRAIAKITLRIVASLAPIARRVGQAMGDGARRSPAPPASSPPNERPREPRCTSDRAQDDGDFEVRLATLAPCLGTFSLRA